MSSCIIVHMPAARDLRETGSDPNLGFVEFMCLVITNNGTRGLFKLEQKVEKELRAGNL